MSACDIFKYFSYLYSCQKIGLYLIIIFFEQIIIIYMKVGPFFLKREKNITHLSSALYIYIYNQNSKMILGLVREGCVCVCRGCMKSHESIAPDQPLFSIPKLLIIFLFLNENIIYIVGTH